MADFIKNLKLHYCSPAEKPTDHVVGGDFRLQLATFDNHDHVCRCTVSQVKSPRCESNIAIFAIKGLKGHVLQDAKHYVQSLCLCSHKSPIPIAQW